MDVLDELLGDSGRGRCAGRTSASDIGLFLSKKSEHRTSAIITESAEFYYPIVSVIIQQLRPRHANNKS